ncbi:MAG TPA: alpha/beta hydrolase-fold protein [Gaiellaceae bacterium]|nr:alpha/beta hydrolase-fold protein [Gaiellaceae bacterium]
MRRGLLIGFVALLVLAATATGGSGRTAANPVRVRPFTFHSRLLARDFREILLLPAGPSRGRQLLVFLHGYTQPTAENGDWMRPALVALGTRAPVVLLVDDGDLTSWWHDRASGEWGSYVLQEVIPAALRRTGADPDRVAIGGISMGGFGALDLARLAPGRFCAVGAHSPGLLTSQYALASGAFDDQADFARHDLLSLAAAKRLYRIPVYLDIGRADDLRYFDTTFADAVRAHGTKITFRLVPGGHSGWAGRMLTYLRWYTSACP